MRPSSRASSISLMKMPLPSRLGGRDEAGLLHAVAGGADDFDLDVVASVAEGVEDVVGLPEGELGASAADADGIAGIVVLAAHVFT